MTSIPINSKENQQSPLVRISLTISRMLIIAAVCGIIPTHKFFGDLNFVLEVSRSFAQFYSIPLTLSFIFLCLLPKKDAEQWSLLAISALTLIVYGYHLSSFFIPNAQSQSNGQRLSVLSINQFVQNRKPKDFLAMINDYQPDIIGITEASPYYLDSINLAQTYSHAFERPAYDCSGLALYHNHTVTKSYIVHFGDSFPGLLQKIQLSEKQIACLYLLHAPPPQNDLNLAKRSAFLSEFEQHQQQHCATLPTILLGDLNFTPFSKAYRSLTSAPLHLLNAASGNGFQPTWRLTASSWISTVIDYILHSKHFCSTRFDVKPLPGSDHAALYAELELCRD